MSRAVSTWRYFLANYYRGFLRSDHSHARLVFGSVLTDIVKNTKNPVLIVCREDLEYLNSTFDHYHSGNYFKEEHHDRYKRCHNVIRGLDDKIAGEAPFLIANTVKLEEVLLSHGIVDEGSKSFEIMYRGLEKFV